MLGIVYLVFAGLAAASFDAWFPFLIFVWLFGVKVFCRRCRSRPQRGGRERETTLWILSVTYFFVAIFVTMFVPIPMLGITEDGEVYGLRGQYEWANFPYKAIAAGFFYFSAHWRSPECFRRGRCSGSVARPILRRNAGRRHAIIGSATRSTQ